MSAYQVSIVALVVSLVTAGVFAWALVIERQRRHEEQRPAFRAEHDKRQWAGNQTSPVDIVEIEYTYGPRLDWVRVELVGNHQGKLGPFLHLGGGGRVALRLDVSDGRKEWVVPVYFEDPGLPSLH